MKVSDYVARFLRDQGIRHAFVLSGGACMHLIDSIAKTDGIENVCCLHEQANAMAADAYARVQGLGVAISTSGPGATNMFTGIACSYYDSVPVLYITGQQVSTRLKGDSGVRQIGFQETSTVPMAKHITKLAVQLERPELIRYELECLVWMAREGRPGPVLLDLPDDFQRAEVDPDAMLGFTPRGQSRPGLSRSGAVATVALHLAERPILIPGYGCRLAGAADLVVQVAERYGLPIAPTWAMVDAIPADHPLLVGRFGTHGLRGPNFAVANADLILAVGTRLDSHASGNNFATFARDARKIVVDIDPAEIGKFGDQVEGVIADAGDFLRALLVDPDPIRDALTVQRSQHGDDTGRWMKSDLAMQIQGRREWGNRLGDWNTRYPVLPTAAVLKSDRHWPDPVELFQSLSRHMPADATILLDTGCTLAWFFQAFETKKGQRIHAAFNNTPMGWSLPAAIGASLALDGEPVFCICGDGGLQINIQELATVIKQGLPIKVLCLNNRGHGMTRQTQDQWFEGKHEATGDVGGLPVPDLRPVARAYGWNGSTLFASGDMDEHLARFCDLRYGPYFLEVMISPDSKVSPQLRFGRPIEDAEPLLSRDEFLAQMLVEPMPISKESVPA